MSVQRRPEYAEVGRQLLQMLEQFVDHHPEALEVVEALRRGEEVEGFPAPLIQEVRARWMRVLGSSAPREGSGPGAAALEVWGARCNDEDAHRVLPRWLRSGAPLGIEHSMDTCGVSPPAMEGGELCKAPSSLQTDVGGWSNYRSAEDEPELTIFPRTKS